MFSAWQVQKYMRATPNYTSALKATVYVMCNDILLAKAHHMAMPKIKDRKCILLL